MTAADLAALLGRLGALRPAQITGELEVALEDLLLLLPTSGHDVPTQGRTAEGEVAPSSPSTPPPPSTRAPGRPLATLSAAELRRLRWKFNHRVDRFALVPAGVTWEAAADPASPWHGVLTGTHRDATGTPSGTPSGTHRDAPSSPSHSPSSPGNPGVEKEEEDARARDRDATGTLRGTGGGTPSGTLRDAPTTPTARPVVAPPRESPLEVLARESGGRVSPFCGAQDQVALHAALADVGLEGEDLAAFGRALRDPAALWPKSEGLRSAKTLTAGFFLGKDQRARMLADGVARWRERRAAEAERARPAVVKAAERPSVADTVAEFRRLQAEKGAR